jgi:hypothetical protein
LALISLGGWIILPQKLVWITGMGKKTAIPLMALKVERQGIDLAVTWDHNSPLVRHGETGRLTIDDGGAREFPLDKKHIRSGSVVYSPVTDHISVQLDLQTSDQRITSESVMVILNRQGTKDSFRPVEPNRSARFRLAPGNIGASDLRGASRASTGVQATREFLPPQYHAAVLSQSAELVPPPAVTMINSAPTTLLAPALSLPHSPPPLPAEKPALEVNINPEDSPRPAERQPDFIPPLPIQQILPPRLTLAQRSFISRTVLVEIKVFIDASGKVKKTELLTPANPLLVAAVQSAASLWTFHPARKAGQNAPSEMILRFKFDPPK